MAKREVGAVKAAADPSSGEILVFKWSRGEMMPRYRALA